MAKFKDDIKTFMEIVIGTGNNTKDGIFNKMNCKFLQANLDRFHKTLCVGLIPNFYQLTICIGIASVATMIASVSVFLI